jgi:hypothetical protein
MARAPSKVAQDFRDVFGSDEGQRVLAVIMAQAGVYQVDTSTEPTALAFNAGQRNIALMIASYLAYKPSEFVMRARQHNEALTE